MHLISLLLIRILPFDHPDHIERVVNSSLATDIYRHVLAEEIGISARTINSAVRAVCDTSPLRYGQLKRLWAVRQSAATTRPPQFRMAPLRAGPDDAAALAFHRPPPTCEAPARGSARPIR